jgi:dipeptidyl aminopeptidase/acylaminoacyl peptidase
MLSFALASIGLATASVSPSVAERPCDITPAPPSQAITKPTKAFRAEDLVELRDIGSTAVFPGQLTVSVSPDQAQVAFQVRRANPAANGYCIAMLVMSLTPAKHVRPVVVDQGGEFIRFRFDQLLGRADVPTGLPQVIMPRWFRDSRSFAFLKRVVGSTQVWRAFADGSASVQLSHMANDIVDFRIDEDGTNLVVATDGPLRVVRDKIRIEGKTGYIFDDRFSPNSSSEPYPAPPIKSDYATIDVATGASRPAEPAEIALFSEHPDSVRSGAVDISTSVDGRRAWTFRQESDRFPRPLDLAAEDEHGVRQDCKAASCQGITGIIGWSNDGRRVIYLRREGWGQELTAIYMWKLGSRLPKKVYQTTGLLLDCQTAQARLLCLKEGSTAPRKLVAIDLSRGSERPIFDPNPQFRRVSLGKAIRLHWKSMFGVECFGDVVLPVGYREGKRYPLIVVQYTSRGFLRGGTGDEYPVQLFANRGYAVLNIERPQSPAAPSNAQSYADLDKADLVDLVDRRNVLSATEIAVHKLIASGLVDPQRVGVTGVSDGASSVQFAGLHSSIFSAAAMSNCCWEPAQLALLGPGIARQYRETGWPSLSDAAPNFWANLSWVANVRKLKFPVLMQMADSEFRSAMGAYTAMKEVGLPVDLFVFPDETHVKWQPAHRLAVYKRSVDWFDFWLNDWRSNDPERQTDIARWEGLRRTWRAADPLGNNSRSGGSAALFNPLRLPEGSRSQTGLDPPPASR